MRNTILVILAIVAFISCDSDDKDIINTDKDAVLGKWVQIMRSSNGENDDDMDECELQETIEFRINNVVIEEDYDPNYISADSNEFNGCRLSKTIEYKWEKVDGSYIFTQEGDVYEQKITFKGENMTISEEEEFNGSILSSSRTFKRVE